MDKLIREDIPQISFQKHGILSVLIGFVTGVGAGLVGVGGGEFRMPFLLWLFNKNVKTAAGVNLFVGSFTVIVAFARRYQFFIIIEKNLWIIAIIFAVFSLLGAYLGAKISHFLSVDFLKKCICCYLILIGVWMLHESITATNLQLFHFEGWMAWSAAAVLGFSIAAISAMFGVAGGEMRIPVLMYIYSIPIKVAGTLSLLVSIPTVLTGAAAYKQLGYLPKKAIVIALLMAAGSLGGILLGVYWLAKIDANFLKGVLGTILLMATLAIALPNWLEKKRR